MSGLLKESTLLDVPCGYGRHSIELAKRGFKRITGLDINNAHLEKARGESRGLCEFLNLDMRDLINTKFLHSQYHAVINMFYSFGFFNTEEENQRVMRGFFAVLKEHGVLLLHTDVSSEILLQGRDYRLSERRKLKDGGVLHIQEHYDPHSKRMNGFWTIYDSQGNPHQLTPYCVRIYSAEEFKVLAAASGFSQVDIYGSFYGEPFTPDSHEMIVVARKCLD